eukprot:gene15957-18971_t
MFAGGGGGGGGFVGFSTGVGKNRKIVEIDQEKLRERQRIIDGIDIDSDDEEKLAQDEEDFIATQKILPTAPVSPPIVTPAATATTPLKMSLRLQPTSKMNTPIKSPPTVATSTTTTTTTGATTTTPAKKGGFAYTTTPSQPAKKGGFISPVKAPVISLKPTPVVATAATPNIVAAPSTPQQQKPPMAAKHSPPMASPSKTPAKKPATFVPPVKSPQSQVDSQPKKIIPLSLAPNKLVLQPPKKLPMPVAANTVPVSKAIVPVDTRRSLRDLGTPYSESPEGRVSRDVMEVTRKNSGDFEFEGGAESRELGFKQRSIGVAPIHLQMLKELAVDQSLLTSEWIGNHYGWIVWKLAAMERAFPSVFGGRHLTLRNVISQLKARFKKEILDCKRPILKKIYERDDSSERHMILCVSDIISDGSEQIMVPVEDKSANNNNKPEFPQAVVELTDGWYAIRAVLDPHLTYLLKTQKIFVGQKLRIQGAHIGGKEGGVSPLEEDAASVHLKIYTNSTRRARWFERLGLQQQPSFPVTLRSIVPGGGMAVCVNVKILKVYPLSYKEIVAGDNNARVTYVRSKAEEEKLEAEYESKRSTFIEQKNYELSEKIEGEESASSKRIRRRSTNPKGIMDSDILYDMYKASESEEFFQGLTEDQQSLLRMEIDARNNRMREKLSSELNEQLEANPLFAKRNVTRILCIKVCDQLDTRGSGKAREVAIKEEGYGGLEYMTPKQLFDSVQDIPLYLPSNNFAPSTLPDAHQVLQGGKFATLEPLPPVTIASEYGALAGETINEAIETMFSFNNPPDDALEVWREGDSIKLFYVQPKNMYYTAAQQRRSQSNSIIAHLQSSKKTYSVSINAGPSSKQLAATTTPQSIPRLDVLSRSNRNDECDVVGVLLYVGPCEVAYTDSRDGKRIDTTRVVYVADSSGYMAKITMSRVTWTSGSIAATNNTAIVFPFSEGFNLVETSMKPKAQPVKDSFLSLNQWLTSSPDALLEEFDKWHAAAIDTVLVPGNHDQVSVDGTVHGLQFLRLFDNFCVATDPIYDARQGVAYLPWREGKEAQRRLFDTLSDRKLGPEAPNEKWTVFAHAEAPGALANGGYAAPGKVGQEQLGGLRATYLGHYHHRQRLPNNTWYIGSPYQQNFGEASSPHGLAIVTSDNVEPTFIDLDHLPRHHRLVFPVDFESGLATQKIRTNDIVEVRASKSSMASPAYLEATDSLPPLLDLRRVMIPNQPTQSAQSPDAKDKTVQQQSRGHFKLDDFLGEYVESLASHLSPMERDHLAKEGRDILDQIKETTITPMGRKVDVKRVEITDFCSINGKLEMDLGGRSMIMVRGSMGVGKSSLFEALVWGLYGSTSPRKQATSSASIKGDEVINDAAKATKVVVELEVDGKSVRIIRSKKRAQGSRVIIEGLDGFKAGVADQQAAINNIVGLDYELFRMCVYLGQGAISNFVTDTDKRRKEMLTRAFSLALCLPAAKLARESRRRIESEVTTMDGKLERMRASLSTWQGIDYDSQIGQWESERKERIETMKKKQEADGLAIVEIKKLMAMAGEDCPLKTSERRDDLSNELAHMEYEQREWMDAFQSKSMLASEAAIKSSFEEESIKKELGTTNKSVQHLKMHAIVEKAALLQIELNKVMIRSKECVAKKESLAKEKKEYMLAYTAKRTEITKALANIASKPAEQYRLEFLENSLQEQHYALEEIEAAVNPHLPQRLQKQTNVERLAREMRDVEEVLVETRKRLTTMQFWETGFGGDGIAMMALNSVVKEVEEYANEYLSVLSHGRLFSTLSIDGDELAIQVFELDSKRTLQERSFYQLSGGQRRCVELAYSPFALSQVIFNHIGCRVTLMVVDELTNHLDSTIKPVICELLRSLKDRENIVVVDHDQSVMSEFDHVFNLEVNPKSKCHQLKEI